MLVDFLGKARPSSPNIEPIKTLIFCKMQVAVSKISIDLLIIENIALKIKATLNFQSHFWTLSLPPFPTSTSPPPFRKKTEIYSNIKKKRFSPNSYNCIKTLFFIHVVVIVFLHHVLFLFFFACFFYLVKFNMHFWLTKIKINKFITYERYKNCIKLAINLQILFFLLFLCY